MVAAGHWRAETEEEKKSTWEESVRLRERMFWTRVGGGVVPSFVPLRDGGSPHSPTFTSDDIKQQQQREERMSEEESIISFEPRDITASGSAASTMGNESPRRKSEEDPFQNKSGEDKAKRISIGNTVLSTRSSDNAAAQELESTPPAEQEGGEATLAAKGNDERNEPLPIPSLTIEEEKKIEQDAEAQLQDEVKKSLEKPALQRQRSSSHPPPVAATLRKKEESSNRLSLRIPGSMGTTSMSMPGAFD
jgi:hypothetical protein